MSDELNEFGSVVNPIVDYLVLYQMEWQIVGLSHKTSCITSTIVRSSGFDKKAITIFEQTTLNKMNKEPISGMVYESVKMLSFSKLI